MTARSVFDAYGRVTEAYDVYDNKTTTVFTPAADALVTRSTPSTRSSTSPRPMSNPRGVSHGRGRPNGARTDLVYDPLGRLEKVWLPGRDKAANLDTPNSKFSYQVIQSAPVVVTTETLKEDGSYRVGYEIYDGMLRLRQTQQPAAGGGRILTDVFYDNRGLAFKKRAAYYNESPPSAQLLDGVGDNLVPSQMRYHFDGMGRPTNEIFESFGVEKWRTVTTYGGDRINVTRRPVELPRPPSPTRWVVRRSCASTAAPRRRAHTTRPRIPTTGSVGSAWSGPDRQRVGVHLRPTGRQIKAKDPDRASPPAPTTTVTA
ncbi:hypothetical protein NKG94_16820 [Micromonospora sp. M12]